MRKIFALNDDDPAYPSGARFAVCYPDWNEWSRQSIVAIAYAKVETLEVARKFVNGGGVFSTYPGELSADFSIEIK